MATLPWSISNAWNECEFNTQHCKKYCRFWGYIISTQSCVHGEDEKRQCKQGIDPTTSPKKVCEACLPSNHSHNLKNRPNIAKKRFASLRFCVSSLHRDHARMSLYCKAAYDLLCIVKQSSLPCEANLLCIVKRLFNAWAETQALEGAIFGYLKLRKVDLKTNSVPFR